MKINEIIDKINKVSLDFMLIDGCDENKIDKILESLGELKIQDPQYLDYNRIIEIGANYISSDSAEPEKIDSALSCIISSAQQYLHNLSNNVDVSEYIEIFEEQLKVIFALAEKFHPDKNLDSLQNKVFPEFISNTASLADEIEYDVLELEKDSNNFDIINKIFRAFHTLKGEANLLSLSNFSSLTHHAEELLDQIRSYSFELDGEVCSVLLSLVDTLKQFTAMALNDMDAAMEMRFDSEIQALKSIIDKNLAKKDKYEIKIPEIDFSLGVDLFADFIAESNEHLSTVEDNILVLEKNPKEQEIINQLFRSFHTIKGVSSFLNLEDICKLSHTSETMLDLLRNGKLTFSNNMADAILASVDFLRNLLILLNEQLDNEGALKNDYIDITPVLIKLQTIIDTVAKESGNKSGVVSIDEVDAIPDELFQTLEIQEQNEPAKTSEETLSDIPPIDLKKDEINIPAEESKQVDKAIKTQTEESKQVDSELGIQKELKQGSIKINVEKLDQLMDLVGELVISEAQVSESTIIKNCEDSLLKKDMAELDRITRLLQEVSMQMRLVPVRSTFQKMARIVRDLSRKMDKAVEIVLSGEDTEIDKNMIELVSDPLVHMVRNCIDHGIENKEERIENGKNPVGKIELSAFHKAGNVVIEIKDDGGGLNKDRILEKAIEKGLVKEGENISEGRIYNLIFEPGFSTAQKVTDVSGRGVGMDVVRRNIEQLRGKIDVKSEQGVGTTFSFYLPITLAIIDGIILRVANERYILPINNILEFISPNKGNLTHLANGAEVYKFHDVIYPVIRMREIFKIDDDGDGGEKNFNTQVLCILESEYGHVGILVDELLGEQQVVIKSLGEKLRDIKGVSGGAILGDGKIGLILDVNGIVQLGGLSNILTSTT